MTLTEFLLARLDEDERVARSMPFEPTWGAYPDEIGQPIRAGKARIATCAESVMAHIARHDPARVLAEVAAKRAIVEFHKGWPVLVQQQPSYDPAGSADPDRLVFRVSQQIAWMTEQQYRAKFGDEPPTAPMLRALVQPYADHPDFREEWRD